MSFVVKTKPDGSTLKQIYRGKGIGTLNNGCHNSGLCCGQRTNEKTRYQGTSTSKGCLFKSQAKCVRLVEGFKSASNPDAPCLSFGTAIPTNVDWTNPAETCTSCPKGDNSGKDCTKSTDTSVSCTYKKSDFSDPVNGLGNVLHFQQKQCQGDCLGSNEANKRYWDIIMGEFCPTFSTSCPKDPLGSDTLQKCSWFLSSPVDSGSEEAQKNINSIRMSCNSWCGARPNLCNTAKNSFCISTDPSNSQCACLNPEASSNATISNIWDQIVSPGAAGDPISGGKACWWAYCSGGTIGNTDYLVTTDIDRSNRDCSVVCQNVNKIVNSNNVSTTSKGFTQSVSCTTTTGTGQPGEISIPKSKDPTRTFWQKYGFAIIFVVIAFVVLIIIVVAVIFLVTRKPNVKKTTITDKKSPSKNKPKPIIKSNTIKPSRPVPKAPPKTVINSKPKPTITNTARTPVKPTITRLPSVKSSLTNKRPVIPANKNTLRSIPRSKTFIN